MKANPFLFFFLQIFTLAVVIPVMIHFNDVARESSVQIITNGTILLFEKRETEVYRLRAGESLFKKPSVHPRFHTYCEIRHRVTLEQYFMRWS